MVNFAVFKFFSRDAGIFGRGMYRGNVLQSRTDVMSASGFLISQTDWLTGGSE